MNDLTLLAIDTSTEACSVALLHNGEKTALDEMAQRTHTKRILPMVDEILAQSGVSLTQLDALVFGRGPGSFTGVRVGASVAQGLAFGADLPVIAVSNLTAMAQAIYEQQQAEQAEQAENVLCAIDARMNEIYFSQLKAEKVRWENHEFLQWNEIIAEQVCSPEDLLEQVGELQGEWFTVGTGWQAYSQLQHLGKPSAIQLPSAQYMLSLAVPMWHQKQLISAVEIEPVYLRNEVTWKKLPGRE